MDCKIKICGLTEEREIACVNRWKPDYIGFMFFPKSKRYISFERARELAEQLSPEIKKVGVFVNADLREMTEVSKILDLIQLHGQESEETIEILKEKTHLPIIRAVSMTEEKDPFRFNHSGADYLLLDSGKGGTGELFDHRKIKGFEKPFFLAGGLTPENARGAAENVRPYGIDLSSGLETNGKKDEKKIEELIRRIRK